jgi:hypothetical protein
MVALSPNLRSGSFLAMQEPSTSPWWTAPLVG